MNETTRGQSPRRRVLLPLCFLLILALLLVLLDHVFTIRDNDHTKGRFAQFYALPGDSLDGICIGSSAVYCFCVTPKAYEESGIALFDLATSSQPLILARPLIEEAQKTQRNLQVIIIEIRSIVNPDRLQREADIRRVTDSMPYSMGRIRAINTALDFYKARGATDLSYNRLYYYVPFLYYHNQWATRDLSTLTPFPDDERFMGFICNDASFTVKEGLSRPAYLDAAALAAPQEEKLTREQQLDEQCLSDLLQYCEGLDAQVVFTASPNSVDASYQRTLHRYGKLIEAAGFPFLNACTAEADAEMGLDWSSDFLDPNHTNYRGGVKYTRWLTAKIRDLRQKAGLPALTDHRGDPAYGSWEDSAETLRETVAEHLQTVELPAAAQ